MDQEVIDKVMSQYINALANAQQQNFTLQAQLEIAHNQLATANEKLAAFNDTETEGPVES